MIPHSCIYEGYVYHRRHRPLEHHFRNRIFMLYVDLDELPDLFRPFWLWSANRPNLAWFRRGDHVGDPGESLMQTIRTMVEAQTGICPQGPIRLLTHFRYFGYVINPISLYYCFDGEQQLQFVVAEVTNTPWEQRHCYVLDMNNAPIRARKSLHVSPFMPMTFDYEFQISKPGDRNDVRIRSFEYKEEELPQTAMAAVQRPYFEALLQLQKRPINSYNLASALLRYPGMTMQVVIAIYWQALRLWLKGADFHTHPDKPGSESERLKDRSKSTSNGTKRSNRKDVARQPGDRDACLPKNEDCALEKMKR